jgi:hypothetical protein
MSFVRKDYSDPFFFGFDGVDSLDFEGAGLESGLLAAESLDVELLLELVSLGVLSAAADFL